MVEPLHPVTTPLEDVTLDGTPDPPSEVSGTVDFAHGSESSSRGLRNDLLATTGWFVDPLQ